MVNLATMGKFDGIPTRKASAKYGGASSATWPTQKPHRFPLMRVTKCEDETQNINILVVNMEEEDETQ